MVVRKVFAVGLPRCGTTSMHDLFVTLGLKSQHLNKAMVRDIGGGVFNFAPMRRFDAFSDSPFPYLWKDLFYRFPKARFILNTRSEDSWLKSVELLAKANEKLGGWRDTENNQRPRNYIAMLFGSSDFDEATWRLAFRRHHLDIRTFFKNQEAGKFLEVNIEEDDQVNAVKVATFLSLPLPEGVKMPRRNNGGVDKFGKFEEIIPQAFSSGSN